VRVQTRVPNASFPLSVVTTVRPHPFQRSRHISPACSRRHNLGPRRQPTAFSATQSPLSHSRRPISPPTLLRCPPHGAQPHRQLLGGLHIKPIRTSNPFASTFDTAPAYWLLDILWIVHATGQQTDGRYAIIEQLMPDDAFAPPHVHPHEDETFWVLEGETTIKVGDETLILGPGSLGHVARNHVHSFKVTGKTVCHILNYYTPASFEQSIIGIARPAERREMPPCGLDPHDSPQVVRYFNNYWVAPADVPWALLKFNTAD
jgi:mannose-6-phosphate isomerase-like protein (cupin superfamily)